MSDVVFKSPHRFDEHRIHAAAVYCSDGRWGENFDDFAYDYLKLLRYDRFAVPGGPATLARRGAASFDVAREHIELLIQAHGLTRVCLIQHADCAYYLQKLGVSAADLKRAQTEDLARAASNLRDIDSSLAVEAYLALRTGPEGAAVVFETAES
jgi:hypothetical protein